MPISHDVLSDEEARPSGTDAELAHRSLHDAEAFTALYQRYAPRVFWFLRSRTTSTEDAADLTQQVFLRCYEALPLYQDRGLPFSAWLFRIARNAAIDLHRRRRPALSWERLLPGGGRDASGLDFSRSTGHPESLELLVAGLPAEKRELLALRFGADLSVAEIAATLDKSEAAVRKQLQRVLGSLKEAYERE